MSPPLWLLPAASTLNPPQPGSHGTVQMLKQFVEADRFAGEILGQTLGTLEGAVGHEDPADAIIQKMLGRQFAHLASTDQHDGLVGKIVKNLPSQFDSGKGN